MWVGTLSIGLGAAGIEGISATFGRARRLCPTRKVTFSMTVARLSFQKPKDVPDRYEKNRVRRQPGKNASDPEQHGVLLGTVHA